jgi:hypothetical protein
MVAQSVAVAADGMWFCPASDSQCRISSSKIFVQEMADAADFVQTYGVQ